MPAPYTDQALAAELHTDPAGLGYAAPIAVGDCNTLANLINSLTGPGVAEIALEWLTQEELARGLLPAVPRILAAGAAAMAAYQFQMDVLRFFPKIDPRNSAFVALFVMLGGTMPPLLTTDEAHAVTHRDGSRAEVLWGQGWTVTADQIADALRA